MPGNAQGCSARRDEDELAAALKYTGEQEIKTARHIPARSTPEAMVRVFTASLSRSIEFHHCKCQNTTYEPLGEYFAAAGN